MCCLPGAVVKENCIRVEQRVALVTAAKIEQPYIRA